MAEIVEIPATKPIPADCDYVLVEGVKGKFVANGSSIADPKSVAYFTPAPFDSLEEAVATSARWADAHSVPCVYVRK